MIGAIYVWSVAWENPQEKKCLSARDAAGNHDGIQARSEDRMKGGRWFIKEEYLKSTAEHHHEEEKTAIEEAMKNNKNFQNGFVAPEDKYKKKEETEDGWQGGERASVPRRADRDTGRLEK